MLKRRRLDDTGAAVVYIYGETVFRSERSVYTVQYRRTYDRRARYMYSVRDSSKKLFIGRE